MISRVRTAQLGLAAIEAGHARREQAAASLDRLPHPGLAARRAQPGCASAPVEPLFQVVQLDLPLIGGALPVVGDPFALIGDRFTLISDTVPVVGDAIPFVRDLVALVGGRPPLLDQALPLVQL